MLQTLVQENPDDVQEWFSGHDICSPLHIAAHAGNIAVVQELLQGDYPVHCKDVHGETALHRACGNGHAEVAVMLVEAGASAVSDPAGGYDGSLPLATAINHGQWRVVRALHDNGVRIDQHWMNAASMGGHAGVVETLLACGLSATAFDQAGKAPLHYAGSAAVVETLVSGLYTPRPITHSQRCQRHIYHSLCASAGQGWWGSGGSRRSV